jgi:hypothetical protein
LDFTAVRLVASEARRQASRARTSADPMDEAFGQVSSTGGIRKFIAAS